MEIAYKIKTFEIDTIPSTDMILPPAIFKKKIFKVIFVKI